MNLIFHLMKDDVLFSPVEIIDLLIGLSRPPAGCQANASNYPVDAHQKSV